MKKIIFIFIVFFMIVTPLYGVNSSFAAFNNLSWFHVEVSPPNAGEQAAYHIYGGVSNYSGVDSLEIYLQWTHHQFDHPSPKTVTVNGVEAGSVSMKEVPEKDNHKTDLKITIMLKKVINANDSIDIKISKSAGIINPDEPRPCYQVSVYLLRNGVQLGYMGSDQYAITQSIVSISDVKIEPAVKGMDAEYRISFITGVNGVLHEGEDIRIKFPKGTTLPANPFSKYVFVNGVQCTSGVYRDGEYGNELRIFSPIDIDANTPVTVYIKKGFGIVNPLNAGDYTLSVSTYAEPDWVESNPFEIAEAKVKNLVINNNPKIVTLATSLKISFVTSPVGFLPKGKNIYVEFPDKFSLPDSVKNSSVQVNGVNAATTVSGNKLVISTPVTVSNNAEVSIDILDEAGIKNPDTPGDYSIVVYTDSDTYHADASVKIEPSTVTNVDLKADYTGVGIQNAFNISFKTGPAGNLTKDVDYIKINFGQAFQLPEEFNSKDITINDVASNNVSIDVYSVIATVPIDIASNSEVDVKIPADFGIKNPTKVGSYSVKVSTSKEITEVESNSLNITVLPVVEFTVSPETPDGQNGFYITYPSVQLSTSNGKDVYFKIDDGNFALYNAPITISDGVHTLYAYAVDSKGNKGDIEKKTFKVDTKPPTVTFDQGKGNIYVNTTHPTLTGKVSKACSALQINGVVVPINDDLTFSVSLDVTNGSPLAVFARSLAGKSYSSIRTVYIDKVPPIIEMVQPADNPFSTAQDKITIQLKVNESGSVTINGEPMDFDGNMFSKTVTLSDGENSFHIVATDLAGNETVKDLIVNKVNETVITLQIGSKEAYIGDKSTELDAAPIIENGTTLVPLRFISEAFGANVEWNGALKVITITYKMHTIQLQINSDVVLVDNAVQKLRVPPVIKNGRTLVPIRFISETFGAKVQWEAETKTVKIAYAP